jgi:hypothetical protein
MNDPLDVTRYEGDHYYEECSECGEPLEFEEFVNEWYCDNPECEVNQ